MSLTVKYTSRFIRQYEKSDVDLKEEVRGKIELFRDRGNHKMLKVHKLHGRLKNRYSFSVNYKFRIVFRYIGKDTAAMLAVGDHDVYK